MKKLLITCLIASAAFTVTAQNWSFDSLATGPLNGQDGWSAPAPKYQVAADPTGGSSAFSGNVLSISNTDDGTWPGVARPLTTISSFSMDFWMAQDSSAIGSPEELFVRFAGWGNFVAMKPVDGVIEITGGSNQIAAPLAWETVHSVTINYTMSGSTATAAEVILDGSSLGTVPGLSIDMSAGTLLEVRSQRSSSVVDNLSIVPEPTTYAALFGLFALGFVAWRRRK